MRIAVGYVVAVGTSNNNAPIDVLSVKVLAPKEGIYFAFVLGCIKFFC